MELANANVTQAAGLIMRPDMLIDFIAPRFRYHVDCIGADGELKWVEDFENLVTTQGKNDLLTKYFKGSAYTAAWFVALYNAGTPVVGDTYASHAGYTEDVNYSNANRPTLTLGTAASGSIDNTASVAAFSMNASTTILGCAVVSNNTKNDTAAGGAILYSAGAFSGGSRAVVNGDTLNVTVTLTVT